MPDENTARAFWVRSPGQGEIRTVDLPTPSSGQVRVRSIVSAISRGTESLVFRGGVPESQWEVMRCPFQEGEFPAPVKYGYMNVGVVEAAPGASGLEGKEVFCLHPHQDRWVVPTGAVTPLPDDLPPERAVLAANMETALNGVWDAELGPGDRVVVVGGGTIGLLVAYLACRIPGTEVTVVDPNPARQRPAERLGADWTATVPARRDADVAFHASGTAEGARSALGAAGVEGRVIELSWFGDTVVPLPLGEDFHSRRLTIRSSQVGRIPPSRAPRWDHARRMEKVLELLRDPGLDILFTGDSPFEELPEVMARLARDGGDMLCHRIRYPG